MKYLKRFDEKTDVKEAEQKHGFDSKSLEDDTIGFKSELEELSAKDENEIKKEIQATTPGLKKSIKKFEDFEIEISMGDEDRCPECDCNPCKCEECCPGCDCNPCKCGECCPGCDCNPCKC